MNLLDFHAGIEHPFFLIAGPCVIESEQLAIETASYLKKVCNELNINFIYKSSFDKANRTSADSFRGLGIEEGLRILEKVKLEVGVPVLTDVHEDSPLDEVSSVVDVLQTPAFLVRQTNFIQNVCRQGLPVNIKKGQFQAPWDMENVVDKAKATGNEKIMVCDRGTSFGYNTLVSDMRGLSSMRSTDCPIVFDATHSVQQPGRARQILRRTKRNGSSLSKSCCSRWCFRSIYGNASESSHSHERWSKFNAYELNVYSS